MVGQSLSSILIVPAYTVTGTALAEEGVLSQLII